MPAVNQNCTVPPSGKVSPAIQSAAGLLLSAPTRKLTAVADVVVLLAGGNFAGRFARKSCLDAAGVRGDAATGGDGSGLCVDSCMSLQHTNVSMPKVFAARCRACLCVCRK